MTEDEKKRKKLNDDISALHKLTTKLESNGRIFAADYQGPVSDHDLSSDESCMEETQDNVLSSLHLSTVGESTKEINHTSNESLLKTLYSDNNSSIVAILD